MRLALLLLLATACSRAEGYAVVDETPVPPMPHGCRAVAAGEALQALIDDPGAGDTLCLAPGRYAGPLKLARGVTIWGPRDAVIEADRGTVISMTAAGSSLLGVTVDGTGGSFDALDAAVSVHGHDMRVEGVLITNAVYGVLVEKSERIQVLHNHVRGDREAAMGLRGDTIRLWETRDSVVEGNLVEDGRDVVVWYSNGNRIIGNHILRGRYGAHFMYSHDNVVERNELRGGVVGVFAMYSRGLTLAHNIIADAAGAAGMGIGIKESGNLVLDSNVLVHDEVGIYIDTSPLQLGDTLAIRGNTLRLDQAAFVFHASGHRMEIANNDVADNQMAVRVDGGGTAVDVDWHDNYFDDYTGYDLDGDGTGDVPYEMRSLTNELIGEHGDLALFRGTPALGLVDAAAKLDPLYQPELILVDRKPRMNPATEVQ